jgi:hypothetical protein
MIVFPLVALLSAPPGAAADAGDAPPAADVRGRITAIRDRVIDVDMSLARYLPRGTFHGATSIRVGFEAPGVGLVASETPWTLTQLSEGGFSARAPSAEDTADVRPGYSVVLHAPSSAAAAMTLQTKEEYREVRRGLQKMEVGPRPPPSSIPGCGPRRTSRWRGCSTRAGSWRVPSGACGRP